MAYRRRSSSYFRDCRYCGHKIHLRQMPAGQWVAFDDETQVHQCGKGSAYDDLEFPSISSSSQSTKSKSASSRSSTSSSSYASQPPSSPPLSPKKERDFSGWIGLILVIAVIRFCTYIGGTDQGSTRVNSESTTVRSEQRVVSTAVPRIATPRNRVTPTPAFKSSLRARVNLKGYDFIYVQARPSINASEVGRIYDTRTEFEAIGRNTESNWVRVRLKNGTEGWIMYEFVVMQGSISQLQQSE